MLGCLLGTVACSGDEADPAPPGEPPTIFGGDRPVELWVPESYDGSKEAPLLILLHGFTASGAVQNAYFGLTKHTNDKGILYAFPDGTVNPDGSRFWNAMDACCDFFDSGVDDSGYLRALIADISKHYEVDAKRIYFMGHSNGGFMSYRMACDHADIVAGIAGLAGAMYPDPAKQCDPSEPVHVLHIHGDEDDSVDYEGSNTAEKNYLGAKDSVAYWAEQAGCDSTPEEPANIDLDENIDGVETTVLRYDKGCSGGSAELWSIVGGSHLPAFNPEFTPRVLDHLLAHPKP